MILENRKSDKSRDLSTLLHKSFQKVEGLRAKQLEDLQSFEDTEQTAIQDKRKRLHYESIRIEEIKKELRQQGDLAYQKL